MCGKWSKMPCGPRLISYHQGKLIIKEKQQFWTQIIDVSLLGFHNFGNVLNSTLLCRSRSILTKTSLKRVLASC